MQYSKQHSFINTTYALMTDATRTLFRAIPEWDVFAALRDGWVLIHDNLTYGEASRLRSALYAGQADLDTIIAEVAS